MMIIRSSGWCGMYRFYTSLRPFRTKRRQCGCCLVFLAVIFVGVVTSRDTCPAWPLSFFSKSAQYCSAAGSDTITDNPLLDNSALPRFKEIEANHVVPGLQEILQKVEDGLADIEKQLADPNQEVSWSLVSDSMEKLTFPLEYSWGIVNHLNGVKNHEELRQSHQKVQPSVVTLASKLAQSRPYYNAMKKLNQSQDKLDGPQGRILTSFLREAKHAGVELEGTEQARFNEITLQLAKLSTDFNNNVLDSTKAFSLDLTDPTDVKGLPDSLKQLLASNAAKDKAEWSAEKGPWRVTLDGPCIEPFLKHSRKRELREEVYRAYVTRASNGSHDNSQLIEEIRKLRQERSKILGYSNFAELSLKSKMAEKPEKVWDLITSLKEKSKNAAEREHAQLQEFANANSHEGPLRQWDIAYWSERQREQLFSFNDEDLRPYFPFPMVLNGLFNLTSFLFGVKIQPSEKNVQVWCEDVQFFDILDENGNHISSFYLDPYTRPQEKRGGAWMDACLGKSELLKTKPVAYLICNQTPPQKDRPSLMTFREVETLFHEFGHGLQHMLTTVPYAAAAGISNVEWDAVELPSQFMENWLYDEDTMKIVSKHYETGSILPSELFDKVKAARKYRAGSLMLRQLHFSALDMELHTQSDHWLDVHKKIADEYALTSLPPLKEDRFPCSFMHIFGGGYAAGYYSYKWAEVLAADAFSAFEETGLTNRESVSKIGRRFRDSVLSLGGGTHPTEVFKQFRGREPEPDALLKLYGLA
ncbi:putative cytosolic oligopeptidase A [Holothuria leucospilota]|uniref:oligopeptidase A n=1 Tax=Holothuria leucospilota TaxID=206669 RepID=A0A9Q1H678_HOLLE|nr:putative cytosolic oligopeptidase A [Holothuria leucospilota]